MKTPKRPKRDSHGSDPAESSNLLHAIVRKTLGSTTWART